MVILYSAGELLPVTTVTTTPRVGPDVNPQLTAKETEETETDGVRSNKTVTATLPKVSPFPELKSTPVKSKSNADHPEKLVEPPLQAEDGSNASLSVDLKHSQSSTHVLENPPPLHHSEGGENEQVRSDNSKPAITTRTGSVYGCHLCLVYTICHCELTFSNVRLHYKIDLRVSLVTFLLHS